MTIDELLLQIKQQAETVDYQHVLNVVDAYYRYCPTHFKNGDKENLAGENEVSCKILMFAHLHQLTKEQTLHCFGTLYREHVLANPDGAGHQNIRAFMQTGWEGIFFEQAALVEI